MGYRAQSPSFLRCASSPKPRSRELTSASIPHPLCIAVLGVGNIGSPSAFQLRAPATMSRSSRGAGSAPRRAPGRTRLVPERDEPGRRDGRVHPVAVRHLVKLGSRFQTFQLFISEFAHKSAFDRGRTDTIRGRCWYRKPVSRPSCAVPTSLPTKWLGWGDTQRYGMGKALPFRQRVRAISGTERDGLKPP